ncbi:MAG: hypothetical protein K2I78_00175 [Clostridia bacterium]|nr:hypothetical protein [Clostridia bacterium]MDE7216064.1 hypothetical protein [Clostridia bacterium]
MARKKIDENTVINRGQYNIGKIVMLTFVGGVFVALGIAIIINIVSDLKAAQFVKAVILVPIGMGLLLCVFGGVALFLAWKDVYHWVKKRITKKRGVEGFAVITDSYSISEGGKTGMNINRYYGFVLTYEINGAQKTFKTDPTFEINEYNYLKSLEQVKIKIYKDYVVINEEFRYGIYTKDSYTGLDKKYFKDKPYSTIVKLMSWFAIVWIVLFIVMFALTVTLKNSAFVIIAFSILPLVIIPLGIIYAVYFFKDVGKKQ